MDESRFAQNLVSASVLFADQYELIELRGSGHFGEVWRARDTLTGREVALKLIDPDQTLPDDAWREATQLTSLQSRYTTVVHGARLSEVGIPYIDMEYISGSSVADALPAFGVAETVARDWALRAARGLHLCHERRLLHRDVKPDNLLLSSVGHVLLGDFGVAATMDENNTADAHGDVDIRAPEVFEGRCSVQSDVYSLGVTLYAMVTGRLPHRLADHEWDISAMHTSVAAGVPEPRTAAPHLSLQMASIIVRATAVEVNDRFESAHELDVALSRLKTQSSAIQRVEPCTPSGRCWDVTPMNTNKKPIHVCVSPAGKRALITTRHAGGKKIHRHCGESPASKVDARLRSIFRKLLG